VRDGDTLWYITMRVDDAFALKIGLTILTRALWEYVDAMLNVKNSAIAKEFRAKMQAFENDRAAEYDFLDEHPFGRISLLHFEGRFEPGFNMPDDFFAQDVERRLVARTKGPGVGVEYAAMQEEYRQHLMALYGGLHDHLIDTNVFPGHVATKLNVMPPHAEGVAVPTAPPAASLVAVAWHDAARAAIEGDAAHRKLWVAHVGDTALLKHPQGVFKKEAGSDTWYAWQGDATRAWQEVSAVANTVHGTVAVPSLLDRSLNQYRA
jgi:hypothetical protein